MNKPQYTLDPQDWEAFRALGHQMMDDMIDHLQSLREQPVWQPVPDAVKVHFQRPLPVYPTAEATVYQEFLDNILPYSLGNTHPRLWGWINTTGTPLGMLAEMLTGAMNRQVGGAESSGPYVELQVIDWFKQVFGFTSRHLAYW